MTQIQIVIIIINNDIQKAFLKYNNILNIKIFFFKKKINKIDNFFLKINQNT